MISLDASALERTFEGLSRATGLIAAVSGGPDSTAMMHLLARWNRRRNPISIIVAIVDHGLRAESAEEAEFVAREARALGFDHRILTWSGAKPQAGLQEQARAARYDLLVALARETGASHLMTAHNLDDQAETLLMRLSRGSGLTGLKGMSPVRDRDGIVHLRPLLDVPKAELAQLCLDQGWAFVTDSSNADERYARIRWRRLAPLLASEGLTAARLAAFARRVAQAEEALDAKAEEAFRRAEPRLDQGGFSIRGAVLAEEPFEIALRVLAKTLVEAGLQLDNSRLQRLESCTGKLRSALSEAQPLRLTVAGAVVDLDRNGNLRAVPEGARQRGR